MFPVVCNKKKERINIMSCAQNRVTMVVQVAHRGFFLLPPKVRRRDERMSLSLDRAREYSVSFVRMETVCLHGAMRLLKFRWKFP